MGAVRFNISTDQGVSFSAEFRLRAGNVPLDLTGATARAQVREDVYSDVALVTLDSEAGDIDFDRAGGAIMLRFAPEHTAAVKIEAEWDVFVYMPDGQSIKVAYGEFVAAPSVTRPVEP